MHKILKRFLACALFACFPLVFSACGSSGDGESVEMTTISGVATKGPIKGALVQIFKLNTDGSTGELLGSGVSGDNGKYLIKVPKIKAVEPLMIKVSGQTGAKYLSETPGIGDVVFSAEESFTAVLDSFDTAKQYTVSPLTEAAYQQLQKFLTENPSATADLRIISAQNARIAAVFGVSDVLAAPSDPAYSAALAVIDQMVETAKLNATSPATNTLQTMNQMNQALSDIKSPAYDTFQADLTSSAAAVSINYPIIAETVRGVVSASSNPASPPNLTDITAPLAVKNLTAVPAAATATSSAVTLTWSPTTTTGLNPVAGYYIYRDGQKIATVTSNSYVDTGNDPAQAVPHPLSLETTYTYYVVAFDAAHNQALPSAPVTATTPAAPNLTITVGGQLTADITTKPFKDVTAPLAPSSLAATTTALNAVLLTWSVPVDNVAVTGYDVYRGGVKIGTSATASFTDTAVTLGVAYSYTVVAKDAAGNLSSASTAFTYTPAAPALGIIIGGQIQ
jgi:chitin-binding protein